MQPTLGDDINHAQDMNSHDPVRRAQASCRTEAVSWRYEVGDVRGVHHFELRGLQMKAEEKGAQMQRDPAVARRRFTSFCAVCLSSSGNMESFGVFFRAVEVVVPRENGDSAAMDVDA